MTRAARSETRRAELLALGQELFAILPYESVSTELLTKRSGVSAGLIYHYFGDKRGFYLASLAASADELLALLPMELDKLPAAVVTFLDHAEARPELFRAVLRGGGGDAAAYAIVNAVRHELGHRVFLALGGEKDASPTDRLPVTAWLGGVEAATLHWLDHADVSREAVLNIALSTLPKLPETG